MLKVEDVCFKIGSSKIINNVNLNCKAGEIITIVGPNGCGKSTLLKIISRIYKPTKGNVKFLGEDIQKYDTKLLAKELSILPQNKSVAKDMTVKQLVEYGRYPHTKFGNILTLKDHNIVKETLMEVNIKHLENRTMSTLSGGESQIAWIGMCVAQKPKLLLLDEPTTFLDISYQIEVLELIKKLNKNSGLTIIMVLHDINQAIKYSDKIYMMKEGEIYKVGIPEKVFNSESFDYVFNVKMDKLYTEFDKNKIYYQPLQSLKKKKYK